jgi:hypothetical protein
MQTWWLGWWRVSTGRESMFKRRVGEWTAEAAEFLSTTQRQRTETFLDAIHTVSNRSTPVLLSQNSYVWRKWLNIFVPSSHTRVAFSYERHLLLVWQLFATGLQFVKYRKCGTQSSLSNTQNHVKLQRKPHIFLNTMEQVQQELRVTITVEKCVPEKFTPCRNCNGSYKKNIHHRSTKLHSNHFKLLLLLLQGWRLRAWRWRQYVPPKKRWYLLTNPRGATTETANSDTVIFFTVGLVQLLFFYLILSVYRVQWTHDDPNIETRTFKKKTCAWPNDEKSGRSPGSTCYVIVFDAAIYLFCQIYFTEFREVPVALCNLS